MAGLHDRVARRQRGRPGQEAGVARARVAGADQRAAEGRQEVPEVRVHRHGDVERRLADLRLVDVHHHQLRVLGERAERVADLADVQAAAQHDDQVGRLHDEVAGAVAHGAGTAAVQRMVGGQDVVRVPA